MTQPGFRDLRPYLVSAYGPTLLGSIGAGAILPVIALTARDLGAGIATAAAVVALLGIGQLLGDLPAGAVAAKFGERRALLGAAVVEFVGALGCFLAPNLAVFCASILLVGLAMSVFGLARQSYLTAVVPPVLRARALSTLGGTHRIGALVGPLLGAAVIGLLGVQGAYLVSMVGAAGAFTLVALARDITAQVQGDRPVPTRAVKPERVLTVLLRHRRVLLTVGVGILFVGITRALRIALLPLWADSIGLSAAQTSLVFGVAGALDLLLFYPGGLLMDRRGRRAVAVPSMAVLGTGMLLLPLVGTLAPLLAVAVVLGIGNGIGSGLILTIGADVSPVQGRAQFLAGWRLMADLGNAGGPALVAGVTLLAPLSVAALVAGGVALLGAGWLWLWVPRRPT